MAFAAKRVREIFGIGWPFALSQALWQLQSMALFLILSSLPRKSVEILAAFSSGLRIESAAFLPAIAFHMASAVITGNLSEKGDVPMLSGGCRDCSDGVSIVIVIALLVVFAAPLGGAVLSDNPVVIKELDISLHQYARRALHGAWVLWGGLERRRDTRSMMFIVTGCTGLSCPPVLPLRRCAGIRGHAVWVDHEPLAIPCGHADAKKVHGEKVAGGSGRHGGLEVRLELNRQPSSRESRRLCLCVPRRHRASITSLDSETLTPTLHQLVFSFRFGSHPFLVSRS